MRVSRRYLALCALALTLTGAHCNHGQQQYEQHRHNSQEELGDEEHSHDELEHSHDLQHQATSGFAELHSGAMAAAGGLGNLLGSTKDKEISSSFNHKSEPEMGGHKHQSHQQPSGSHKQGELSHQDITKYFLNPLELVKVICAKFNLPADKFIDKLGGKFMLGLEAFLHPIVASVKIIEKVFAPDSCKLKLLCLMGSKVSFVKESLIKLPSTILEGSEYIKAMTDGIRGENCDTGFGKCELKLKKPFEAMREMSASFIPGMRGIGAGEPGASSAQAAASAQSGGEKAGGMAGSLQAISQAASATAGLASAGSAVAGATAEAG